MFAGAAKLWHMANGTDPPYANLAPGGRDMTTEEHEAVLKVFERHHPIPEDPTLDVPGFEDSETLERAHHNVFFFLDSMGANHLIDAVLQEDNHIGFLGARIYVVPHAGLGPTVMFEAWYLNADGWERNGTFGTDWKVIEHCYINFVRKRVKALANIHTEVPD
jgi:hypothetical protein